MFENYNYECTQLFLVIYIPVLACAVKFVQWNESVNSTLSSCQDLQISSNIQLVYFGFFSLVLLVPILFVNIFYCIHSSSSSLGQPTTNIVHLYLLLLSAVLFIMIPTAVWKLICPTVMKEGVKIASFWPTDYALLIHELKKDILLAKAKKNSWFKFLEIK